LVGLLIVPNAAQAHVRWFVDPNSPEVATFEPYTLLDPAVLIWIAIAAVARNLRNGGMAKPADPVPSVRFRTKAVPARKLPAQPVHPI
jgi:hypothetical protein